MTTPNEPGLIPVDRIPPDLLQTASAVRVDVQRVDHSVPAPSMYDRWIASQQSSATQRTYRDAMARLCDRFAETLGKRPDEATAAAFLIASGRLVAMRVADDWRSAMLERDVARATISLRLSAMRALCKYAREQGEIDWALDVKGVKARKYRDTSGCGRDGFDRMVKSIDPATDLGARDLAVIRLLFDLALRRREVVALDRGDVDFDARRLWILGKGRGEKEPVSLPKRTFNVLREWVTRRARLIGSDKGPLFFGMDFRRAQRDELVRLTGKGVWDIVRRVGKAAGLARLPRPHGLRHAAGTDALDKTGGDVRAVQKFMRHADANTTLRYNDNRLDQAGKIARLLAGDEE